VLAGVDEPTAHWVFERCRAAAAPPPPLQQRHATTALREGRRGGEPGESTADDDHTRRLDAFCGHGHILVPQASVATAEAMSRGLEALTFAVKMPAPRRLTACSSDR
jgi:hypothetical protein